jgi:hypothetical protein
MLGLAPELRGEPGKAAAKCLMTWTMTVNGASAEATVEAGVTASETANTPSKLTK